MGPHDTVLSLRGNFSWGFTSNQKKKKGDKKDNKIVAEEVDDENENENDKKKLSKFITLRDIKMDVKKGEFICIIGDVGSGKSSLLHSIIGDLIYLPQEEIDSFGGMDHEGNQEDYDTLK